MAHPTTTDTWECPVCGHISLQPVSAQAFRIQVIEECIRFLESSDATYSAALLKRYLVLTVP